MHKKATKVWPWKDGNAIILSGIIFPTLFHLVITPYLKINPSDPISLYTNSYVILFTVAMAALYGLSLLISYLIINVFLLFLKK